MPRPAVTSNPLDRLRSSVRGVFYGWWLVGVAAVMLTLMSLSVFQGLGTFLDVVEGEFGWSRTVLAGAFSLARVQGAVIGPFEGWLVDRMGTRRMLLIGYTTMGIGFLTLAGVPNIWPLSSAPNVWPFIGVERIWHFYASFIVISLGSSLGGWLAIISMVNNWFIRQRSIAMATAMSGIHFGGFLVPVLALGLEFHGLHWTALGIGLFLLAIILPVTKLVRDRPEEYGLRPDGAPLAPPRRAPEDGSPASDLDDEEPEFTARQALATPTFWALTVVHLSSTLSIVTLSVHLVPKLTDMGMSLSGAGIVVLTYTAVALPSQFVAGYIADRLPKPAVIFVFLMIQAISILVIALAESVPMAFLFAVLYGVGFGGRIPLLTAIRGEYFGRKAFATIMGLSQLPNSIFMIGAPLFAGYLYDTRGTYFVPFASFAALNVMGAFLMLFIKRPAAVASAPAGAPHRQ